MEWITQTNLYSHTMSLFSKIFSVFKKKEPRLTKEQIKELTNIIIQKNQNALNELGDFMDYDGMGNYGRFPPIIGDDHPTYEEIVKEYESQNSK